MAKQDTINVAGRDVDLVELINTGIDKSQQWEQYQQLQGDEINDFRTALNEINQNLADGVYYFNKYGRIIDSRTNKGITEEYNYYRESDGAKKDGAGKWYNSRRRGFNPYGNVETYLNGVARILNAPKKEDTETGKKKWTSSTKNTLLGNAIFGEGNEQNPSKNSAQLEAWANTLDKPVNGVRGTSERRKYIWENILNPYRTALINGEYDIDEESKNKEITALNEIENHLDNDWLLGKYSPLISSYLFTGEKYLTPRQTQEQQNRDELTAWLNNPDPEAAVPSFVSDPSQYAQQRQLAVEKARQADFDNYNQNGTLANNVTLTYNNPKQKINQPTLDRLMSRDILDIPSLDRGARYIYFSNLNTMDIDGKSYYPDFENGDLYIIYKNGEESINVQIVSIADAIKNSKTKNKNLYNYLRDVYYNYKGYFKKGGILKASGGAPMVKGDDPDEGKVKPQPAATPDTKVTVNFPTQSLGVNTTLPSLNTNDWIFPQPPVNKPFTYQSKYFGTIESKPNETEVKSDDSENTEVRTGNYVNTPKYDPTKSKHPSDVGLDLINSYRQFSNKLHNIKSRDELLALQGVHVNPYRLERLIHSKKREEDAIAQNNAKYGQFGKQLASRTANSRLGMAAQLNAFDKLQSQNAPIIGSIAQGIIDQTDKTIENENNNFVRDWEAQQKNHQADVALHNYKHQQMAEYYNRQGRYEDAVLQEMQRGIAQGAMENFEEQQKFAIANDPDVIKTQQELYNLLERQQKGEQVSDQEINLARFNYNKAVSNAQIKNSPMYQKRPRGYTYAPYQFVYTPQVSSPVPVDKQGGKLLAAEEEKTKRMYAKMLFDMMKMDTQHLYKQSRDAYKDYRKIFMQQSK